MTVKLIFPALFIVFMACSKPSTPTPATTTTNNNTSTTSPKATVVVSQQINNTYTITGNNSYPTIAGEETLILNGNNIYVLLVDDPSQNSLQFWFAQKPTAGVYSVAYSSTSVPTGQCIVGLTLNGVDYASLGVGSVSVSINSSGNYVVTANSIPLQNITANSTIGQSISGTVTIP